MAKNMQPIAKRCKALGISPTVMGYSKKETKRKHNLTKAGLVDAADMGSIRKQLVL